MDATRTAQVEAVAALAEPTRRRLYDHVVRQAAPVSRDEAATAVGVPRPTVAFHLDRLVDDGLLDVVFERRTGRSGPGAGRPSKLYRRSECSVSVSLPERRYDLAGELLAASVAEAERTGERPAAVLARRAFERGRELAAEAESPDVPVRVLEDHGFEPRIEDDAVVLANCPFHVLARDHPDLVCGMNVRLLEGLLDGLPEAGFVARLRPTPGRCCVRLERDPEPGDR
jgi:predicted ArsR family transcriptional regulator